MQGGWEGRNRDRNSTRELGNNFNLLIIELDWIAGFFPFLYLQISPILASRVYVIHNLWAVLR